MLGYFGDIIFRVNSRSLLNFSDLTRDEASRYNVHEIIGAKPKTEFVGPGLGVLNFTVNLHRRYGIDVKEELDKWIIKARNGEAETFALGNKPVGVDKWTVQSVSESFDVIHANGVIESAKVSVTLEEYISTDWRAS